MMSVDRTAIDLPHAVRKELARSHLQAELFYKRKDRFQERFTFDLSPLSLVREALDRLFDKTCAYCESPENFRPLYIHHFRPTTEAANLDGRSDPDWYWWLAYEWENLYLACGPCSQFKKNLFPIRSKRVPIGTKGQKLEKEKPILLDPCVDSPAKYLRFRADGLVESISTLMPESQVSPDADRGAVTIEVFQLNHPELTERRRERALEVEGTLNALEQHRKASPNRVPDALIEQIYAHVDEFSSYVAVKRQIVADRLVANPVLRKFLHKMDPDFRSVEDTIADELSVRSASPTQRTISVKSKAKLEVAVPKPIDITFDNIYIRRIQIHNFRAIQDLDITLNEIPKSSLSRGTASLAAETDSGSTMQAGWKVLLGENGAGKSSVLKAVALAIMGEDFWKKNEVDYRLEAKRIFNKNTRERTGKIRIELSKGEPIEVVFTKQVLEFVSGRNGAPGAFVRGFGSARLFSRLPRRSDREITDQVEPLKDVANLFSPEILLANPEEWLEPLEASAFNGAALAIRDLLYIPKEIKLPLRRRREEVLLDSGYGRHPLSEQSDGYNSLLALAFDIISALPTSLHDKSKATGIILIDEIDSHLHPRWKMRITSSLRRAFPNLQFIVTTHEPLCLRGLGPKEVTVMKRVGSSISVTDDTPSTLGLRVDQILTSELFGLDSTIDPEIDDKFYRYYQLLANTGGNTRKLSYAKRTAEIKNLRAELQQYNRLGFTRRDQLVYELIDEYLSKTLATRERSKLDELRAETKRKVFELWDLVSTQGGHFQ